VGSLTTRIKDQKERAKRLREFRKGEIKMLTCYDMLNEGIDVPDVDFIVYLRVTHSRIIFLQQLGRGLRYKPGKTLFVLDFVADIRRLDEIVRFKGDFDDDSGISKTKGTIEELDLPSAFELSFTDENTKDFLNLVQADQIELSELELDDTIE
jgi:superfamily II DNA or RNA helicase